MKINFAALSEEERATQFAALDNDALTASLAEARTEATVLFALDAPTVEQVDEAETLLASIGLIEAEDARRRQVAEDAAKRFAAARQSFSVNDGVEDSEDDSDEDETDEDDSEDESDEDESDDETDAEDGDETVEAATGKKKKNPFDKSKDEEEAVTTASGIDHTRSQRIRPGATARKVGGKTKRPAVKASQEVVITASSDVPGFATGAPLNGMAEVAKAVQARVKGFAPFNKRSAEAVRSASGDQPVLSKFGVASFGVDFDDALTASGGASGEYEAVGTAVKQHVERITASLGLNGASEAAMTAAMAWCAPSEVVYNWIADYVVDGLLTLPEVNAPRGGLMMTEGPQLAQTTYGTGAAVDGFGFGGTEAQMEAGYVKTCETITCPEFEDHRLDFDGYCWKIPILTEKAFPELVADALRLTDVLYAHKMNRRFIRDVVAGSTATTATDVYGGSVVDTLEALVQIATKERRWWNLGENAIMEVKLPQYVRDIFKFDMSRRSGLALNDIATDQKIAAHFANHRLAVEYISDFDDRHGAATPTADWPDTIRAIIYPAGTFVKAVEDVINLSAVYDAASLSQNEYTGVFFEQGVMTVKRGYRSTVVTIPVCTAGTTGGNLFSCGNYLGAANDEVPA